MENYISKSIAADQIREDFPFCCRYRPASPVLQESIAKRGVLTALVVTKDARPAIVSGHRRYQAARKAGIREIPVFEIQENFGGGDYFILAVLSNWNQNWPDLDRAWTLHRAKEKFHLAENDLTELILPALGLPAGKYILNQYQSVAGLDRSILDLMAEDKLPFRGSQILSRFSPEDQRQWSSVILPRAALTTNQLLKAGEWLCDLLKKERLTLSDFMGKYGLGEILYHPEADRRQKAKNLYEMIRHLRFPRLAEYEKKFQTLSKSLQGDFRELKLEAPESFEAQGFNLHARIRDGRALANILKVLERQKPSLNSLFDIML